MYIWKINLHTTLRCRCDMMENILNSSTSITAYFTNKLGYRSYSNCKLFNRIKRRNVEYFFKLILMSVNDKELKEKLFHESMPMLTELKNNLEKYAKEDFSRFFDNNKPPCIITLVEIDKMSIANDCHKGLENIIPFYFFGCIKNKICFENTVTKIIHGMYGEHFYVHTFTAQWQLHKVKWVQGIASEPNQKAVISMFLLWIFKNILAPIIAIHYFVTNTKLTQEERKLYFFHKNQWQRLQNLELLKLFNEGCLVESPKNSLSKSAKRKYNKLQKLKMRHNLKSFPKIYFVLKSDQSFRPIVRYKKDKRRMFNFNRKILLKTLHKGITPLKLEKEHITLHTKWNAIGKPKLYFVKADLTDAFGSIIMKKLLEILSELHVNYQKNENNMSQKKIIASQYKQLVAELKNPVLVRCGSSVFQWRRGLIQGQRCSPALCEIYYNYLENQHLKSAFDITNERIEMYFRVVDDYLFITNILSSATHFLKQLSNLGNINSYKTITNFHLDGVKKSKIINFVGFLYDTSTLEISRAETTYSGQICYKITFNKSIESFNSFLEKRIGQTTVPISPHVFNLYYNTEENVWKQIFITLFICASKFCTIISILGISDALHCFSIYKRKITVNLCNLIIKTICKNKSIDKEFIYCINHFRYLSFRALYIVTSKTSQCGSLIPIIKIGLAKTDCMNGKWKNHARLLDNNGTVLCEAQREICRNSFIKKFINNCKELPEGFEIYNGIP